MPPKSRMLNLWLSITLVGFMVGCSSGVHSSASRPVATGHRADTSRPSAASQPTGASQPVYLANLSCWDTESCCILKDPLTAANRCMVSPARVAEVVNGVKTLYGATQSRAATLKDEAQEEEDSKFAEAAEAEGVAAPEPPDCQGQSHHVISRPIAKALERHETLRGLYEPRDERYVAKAKDRESHCGYQKWHRDVDLEVIKWLRKEGRATAEEFMAKLREIYSREDILKRFPNGF